jgi:hypothetical protein
MFEYFTERAKRAIVAGQAVQVQNPATAHEFLVTARKTAAVKTG